MSQVPATISKLYELMASGQFEIEHGAESEAAIAVWMAEQLGPGGLTSFARAEALRIEPGLNPWPPRNFDGDYALVVRGVLWAQAETLERLWLRALLTGWRTQIWRARVEHAIAVHVARGERVA